jgi:two-component system sensor histidine kinase PilS (NtrC family)
MIRRIDERKGIDIKKNIEWLMFLRVVVISVLLGASVIFQYTAKGAVALFGRELIYLYLLIGFTYFLTGVYIVIIPRLNNLRAFAYFQLFWDVMLITGLVLLTGGIDSIFTFMYIPLIIAASIILYRSGGFIIASISSILFGVVVDLIYFGFITPYGSAARLEYSDSYIFYNIFIYITAFYLVAFLSGYLAEQVKRTGEELIEKKIDYEELKILNNEIMQNIQTGLISINKDGLITSINRQAESITGRTLKEVWMSHIDDAFPNLLENVDHSNLAYMEPGLNRWDKEFISHTGRKYQLGCSMSPLTTHTDEEAGKIILFQDITRIREMEREIKRSDRLATLGKLAANLAHEIRNPLAAMSGSIQILNQEMSLSGENKHLMNIVLQEIDRLNHLITDFLLYARPTEIKRHTLDLKDVITETIELFRNTPKGTHNISIKTAFRDDSVTDGDFMQLKQVFWNIFLNSAEAMSEGGVISVSMENGTDATDGMIELRIRDTGPGIDPKIRESVFDPFFSTKDGGTGLGLSTVKQIIELHGGSIAIGDADASGAEIIIRLQRHDEAESSADSAPKK